MPPDRSTEATLVTVARFDWLMEADLARCRLDACEIESHMPEEFFGSIYWHYVRALGGFRVQVSSDDVEDALAVLYEAPVYVGSPILDEAEALADRFARAASFGTVVFPLGLYALWLLFRVFCVRERLTVRARCEVAKGLAILGVAYVGPVVVAVGVWLGRM
jgi:hypothetical protein